MTARVGVGRALLLAAALPALHAQQGDQKGEAQPDLPASIVVPPAVVRTPAEELLTFKLQPGFRIELAAAEPLVADPIAVAFDAKGRAWVVEMRGFMRTVDGDGELAPTGRIVVLEDQDGDGRMDRSTTFLDGLVLPRAVLPLPGGALVIAPPDLLWARDQDGDLHADGVEVVANGFDAGRLNPEHAANGLVWGLDNLIHLANHPCAFRRTAHGFEPVPTSGGGQWGLSQDDRGRWFFDYNEDWLRCDLLPNVYGPRSAHCGGLLGTNFRVVEDTSVFPIHVTPGCNRGYQPGVLHDGVLVRHTAACAPCVYRGDLLDARGDVFVCEPAANVVRRFALSETEGRLSGRNVYPQAEFLASTDERFRPVQLANGPDGALWLVDMYRGVIQHKNFVTSFLRKQIESRGLERPLDLGRLWRIVPDHGPAPRTRSLADASVAQLVAALSAADGWQRDQAQLLLVSRAATSAVPELRALLRSAADERTRAHALWTLDGLQALTAGCVIAALYDAEPEVRIQGLRLAGPQLAGGGGGVLRIQCALVAERGSAPERWQLALALGELRDAWSLAVLCTLVATGGDDDVLRSCIANAAVGRELELLAALVALPSLHTAAPPHGAMLALLARSIVGGRQMPATAGLLEFARTRLPWQQRALLQGAVAALPPGAARAGYLTFTATPPALVELQRSTDTARLAIELLSAVALQPEVAFEPSSADRELSAAGARVYANVCAACHQPDGRGLAGLAPPLRDSDWVLGPDTRLCRIVLHGVRGPISAAGQQFDGEMPSQAALADQDLAAALSYLRQAWGHRGKPVAAAAVTAVRQATAERKEAWSAAELLRVQ